MLIDQPIQGHLEHISHYMNWSRANSKVRLTRFVTHPNIVVTSRSTPKTKIEQHPPPQSPPIVANMHDERLQPPP